MPLTPLDIQNKEFRRALRGYNEQDVDEFLDEIVRDFEGLVRESASLREQIGRLEERLSQYTEIEDVLKRTLISAEEAAGEMRTAARKDADLTIREAKEQARKEIEAARHECAAAREDLARIRQEYRNFLARIKGELKGQLEAVESLTQEELESSRESEALWEPAPPEQAAVALPAPGPVQEAVPEAEPGAESTQP